jgi:hypothetical protein
MVAEEFVEEKTRSPKVDLPVRSSIRMNDAFANGDETLGQSCMNSMMAANVPVVRGAPVFGDSGSYLVPNLYFNVGSIPGASTVLV